MYYKELEFAPRCAVDRVIMDYCLAANPVPPTDLNWMDGGEGLANIAIH